MAGFLVSLSTSFFGCRTTVCEAFQSGLILQPDRKCQVATGRVDRPPSPCRHSRIRDAEMHCSDDGLDSDGPSSLDDATKVDRSVTAQTKERGSTRFEMERRDMLLSLGATGLLFPLCAMAAQPPTAKSLEDLQFGHGKWSQIDNSSEAAEKLATETTIVNPITSISVPASFATYLTRFLINYDDGVAGWWKERKQSYSLLSDIEQQSRLGRDFGSLAASVLHALQSFVESGTTNDVRQGYEIIFDRFVTTYVAAPVSSSRHEATDEVRQQLLILAATLPPNQQPIGAIKKLSIRSTRQSRPRPFRSTEVPSPSELLVNLSSLLPLQHYTSMQNFDGTVTIQPTVPLYQVGVGEEFGQAATATTFGPLASNVLTRDLPRYTFDVYALFSISGATGCALTHSIVIPLDVVKTKAQTNPEEYSNILTGAGRILRQEGVSGLLTGAQATLAGYFWYGLSVYPTYTFIKRYVGHSLLPSDLAMAHANDIALIAGALAAVVASLGLTPLEAARIRVVADPQRYKPLGLVGTLRVIAAEGGGSGGAGGFMSGGRALYAGLPSLMTRQVIFGSIKFLAFERACESMFVAYPSLRDTTATALAVSLVAGGFAGALSSLVSQPADAVLTYVAAQETGPAGGGRQPVGGASGKGLGVVEGCRLMIEESGPSSLFRGLGSRSLWAAAIIAGQFLLYDVFRNYFGVSTDQLSQIFQIDM